jgi:glycosyltransferase involved in cell wall biosynthesis
MAMAKPIVASDLDQIGWVLRGWKPADPAPPLSDRTAAAAILVEPGDVNSLIQGIQAAINLDRADRRQLGQRARKLVMESFTWDQNVRTVLTRFEQFPGTGSPPAGAELHSGR